MDNQLVQPKASVQRIPLRAIAIMLIVFAIILSLYFNRVSDPYIQEVFSLKGDIVKGHAIFTINCSACHGLQADGVVGPSLHHVSRRKSRVNLIYQVTSGETPPMPQFLPNSQEMADLLSFLQNL